MVNTKWSTLVGKDVQGKTSEEVIKAAGLDWKVQQAPVTFKGLYGMETVADNVVNFRDDNGKVLGIVGDGYKILQNSQAFQFLDGVVGSSEAMYVNAGSFRDGRKIYIQAKLPGYIRFNDADDIGEKYLTFITSHDGSLSVSVMFTPIRIICQNTLNMALRTNECRTSSRHTSSLSANLIMAKNALNLANTQVSLLESLSRKLIARPFEDKLIPEFLEKSGLVPRGDKSTRAENIIHDVSRLFHYGKGSEFSTSKNTAWGAYNAVSEYVDHYRGSNNEKRAESLLLGSGARIKEKALELLAA